MSEPNVILTNITPPRVPLTDSRTGLISREWYRFFFNLFQLTGSGTNYASLTDLQVGPPVQEIDLTIVDPAPAGFAAYAAGSTQESQIAEIEKQLQGLASTNDVNVMQSQVAELQKQIEGLQVTPPPRQFAASRYGSFYDTTTQTATTINTAKAITFNNTDLSRGVYLGTPTSRVYVDSEGIYNFDTSFQLDKTSGGLAEFYFWFRLNGTDVPDSASQIRIQGNNAEIFSSLNYFFDLKANDYVELMFSVNALSVEITAFPAAAPVPAIPSIILTVNNNIGGFQ
jgi:hypothetical protein